MKIDQTTMKQLTLNFYNKGTFTFRISKEDDGFIEGKFEWSPAIKAEIIGIVELLEAENDCWYLDENGERLNDKELFEASPWRIVDSNQKIVQRFMDFNSGRAKFSTSAWTQLGDYTR